MSFILRSIAVIQAGWHRAAQTARLCCGVPDYEGYLQHLREHHPERAMPSYAEFFRERQRARYRNGGNRCC